MAEKCVNLGCPEVIRIVQQDACSGAPVPGAGNAMVMKCTRNVGITARIREGESSEFVSDCGQVDDDVQDDVVTGYDITLETSRISPELQALLLGHDLLVVDGVNVGFIEEAIAGCAVQNVRPTFLVEAFYRVRQCDASGDANYQRRVIPGVKFQPVENDKEGQIQFERYNGRSKAVLTAGLVNPVSETAGPFQDFPDDIYTALAALDAGHLTVGLRFTDPIASPTNGITLAANTCYTATVPQDV